MCVEPATAVAYEAEKSRCAALHPTCSVQECLTDRVAAEAVGGVRAP